MIGTIIFYIFCVTQVRELIRFYADEAIIAMVAR